MKSLARSSRVLLCVTGGIAAYKAPHLVRGFIRSGWEVKVVMTEASEAFVSPMVLATLSHNRVWRDRDYLSDESGWHIPHISLAEWADVIVIAPCTADTAARLAIGNASKVMDGAVLASKAPVVVFPAMNVNMLDHNATRRNLDTLESMGYVVVDPDSGDLACGYEGRGRLPDVDVIVAEVERALRPKDLAGLSVVVTAGPTREFLDPVRYISNPSSGKMGYAIAKEAWYRGAEVRLISGPVALEPPHGIQVIPVTSAEDMLEAAIRAMDDCDVMVKAAAVGDYRFVSRSEHKIKREGKSEVSFSMVANPDIAATLGKMKKTGQILVGFAAETDDLKENALRKLRSKGLDLIVANDLTEPGSGFGTDTNRVTIFDVQGNPKEIQGDKTEVAGVIWDEVLLRREGS
ncbi:bifunctional phosphopantothenoylcysteine decarboxylase/phosphopantothenate--cysteine ligase CoaBC [Dethiosulfovibrio sp. F2B]|uniref:bifunctional phosphopantothenoylcysteine decarboxylase/phosphopantothenate--cysteine ligase CoaBC n=1 Tax=Dethiosulfovibrio faecalis TaxID=2720018 RepID=UPI001F377CCF|nr:bifunctional phosphopantothenoylcysteine decarboxylase/phosphopantothenate--cysteine ligase CoaBC [Dethiosulfovibrio faecalis]MCF4150328.1 bifunctional phosphopantothenoylcysteine decarboxylase/phosphopantothenate--cysteine ligase CoaBC [Dethiosulfovibrio faecalis]